MGIELPLALAMGNHWVGAWDGKSGMTSSSGSGGHGEWGGGGVCCTVKVSDDCGRNEKKHQSPDIVGPRSENNEKCKAVLICDGKVGGVCDEEDVSGKKGDPGAWVAIPLPLGIEDDCVLLFSKILPMVRESRRERGSQSVSQIGTQKP
ncbi:hypothetical protein B0H13DRAFT_1858323 [Mycena leptocephala]|nr:hypothetical protein B0H13DRAFT_1858323 [Mycena leptocephala]